MIDVSAVVDMGVDLKIDTLLERQNGELSELMTALG